MYAFVNTVNSNHENEKLNEVHYVKISKFYLISWCRNFAENLSFSRVSGGTETVPCHKISTPGNYLKFRYFMHWK